MPRFRRVSWIAPSTVPPPIELLLPTGLPVLVRFDGNTETGGPCARFLEDRLAPSSAESELTCWGGSLTVSGTCGSTFDSRNVSPPVLDNARADVATILNTRQWNIKDIIGRIAHRMRCGISPPIVGMSRQLILSSGFRSAAKKSCILPLIVVNPG